jgi:hypothetical protein
MTSIMGNKPYSAVDDWWNVDRGIVTEGGGAFQIRKESVSAQNYIT